ncbi:hypothetical protein [Variovorax sp. KK3]|uniref:hypothetical protein n=1 Tax=Variovorax sp. KK3 TaxID=1855728 RepID=UPI00097C91C6|nr:hypothetical protein [Variovorax sp. KK3]
MKEQIKRIKGLSVAGLVIFLTAITLTAGPVRLAKTIEDIERRAFVAALIKAEFGNDGRLGGQHQAKFDLAPMMAPRSGSILGVIRDEFKGEDVRGGVLTSADQVFSFTRNKEPSASEASLIEKRLAWEKLYTGANATTYQSYSLESLARPGIVYRVLLADGETKWTGVAEKTSKKWILVQQNAEKPDEPVEENGSLDLAAVESQLIYLASPWLVPGDKAEGVYGKVLKIFREQVIKIPVLQVEVLSPWVGIAIGILALYVAVSLAHAIYQLRDAKIDDSEPWIAYQSWKTRNRLEAWIFRAFAAFGAITTIAAIVLPLGSVLIVQALLDNRILMPLLVLIAIAVAITLVEFVRLLRNGSLSGLERASGGAGGG